MLNDSYELFQALRLLYLYGYEDSVIFETDPSLAFPEQAYSLHQVQSTSAKTIWIFIIRFLGLFGVHGTLPLHDRDLIIQSMHKKNHQLKDFLNIFNHQIVQYFWRSYQNKNVILSYENRFISEKDSSLYHYFISCCGLATFNRKDYFARLYQNYLPVYFHIISRCYKSANGLSSILKFFFKLKNEIIEFEPLKIKVPNQSRFLLGVNSKLAIYTWMGNYQYRFNQCFRVRLYLNHYRDLLNFFPGSLAFNLLNYIITNYLNSLKLYKLELVLPRSIKKPIAFDIKKKFFLGWNTWIFSKKRKYLENPMFQNLTCGDFKMPEST